MIDSLDLRGRVGFVQIARDGAWEHALRIPAPGHIGEFDARVAAFGADATTALELFADAHEFIGFRFAKLDAATRTALLRDLLQAALADGGTLGDAVARLPAGEWLRAPPERFELGVLNAWRTNPTLVIPRSRVETSEADVADAVRAYGMANESLLSRITLECAYERPHEHWYGQVLLPEASNDVAEAVSRCMRLIRAAAQAPPAAR